MLNHKEIIISILQLHRHNLVLSKVKRKFGPAQSTSMGAIRIKMSIQRLHILIAVN